MIRPFPPALEDFRIAGEPGDANGAFMLKRGSTVLKVICSNGGRWDHVSVSLKTRTPTWDEMCWIKDKFFRPDETVIQFHPAKADYVNFHPFCLHLWRPQTAAEIAEIAAEWAEDGERWIYPLESPGAVPLPPAEFVGPRKTSD